MFSWAKFLNLSWLVDNTRVIASRTEFMQYPHFIYSFPYAFWVVSFCCCVGSIWHRDVTAAGTIWRVTAPVIAIGSEILQFVGLLPGSFDVIDLLVLIMASIFGIIVSLL